jgi:vacuolar-type H+-ATPase subunit H
MKLLVNDKEIAFYLNSLLDPIECVRHIKLGEKHTSESIGWALQRKNKTGQIPKKFNEKIIEKVTSGVRSDLDEYVNSVTEILEKRKKAYQTILSKNIDQVLSKFNEQEPPEPHPYSGSLGSWSGFS